MTGIDGELLAYTRSDDVRLIRRKHRIGMRIGESVVCILAKLANVPSGARLDEVIDGLGTGGDIVTLEFHEEFLEKAL